MALAAVSLVRGRAAVAWGRRVQRRWRVARRRALVAVFILDDGREVKVLLWMDQDASLSVQNGHQCLCALYTAYENPFCLGTCFECW
jgi:hypothetical protein